MGYSVECASEIEFVLFDRHQLSSNGSAELVVATCDSGAYRLGPLFEVWPFLDEVVDATNALGIEIESFGAEAAAGQFEINLARSDPLTMADRHMLYRFAVREAARRHGLVATFMARPTESYGSSCHFHASLWNASDGSPADDRAFGSFVAGQLDLAVPLLPMMAPIPNSYRRFAPHLGTPTRVVAGRENRTASIRVIHDGTGARVENRLPGADVNPYFGLAALLAQTRFGIEHELGPPELVGQYIGARDTRPVVPDNLAAAIASMESNAHVRDLFGELACDHVLGLTRHECEQADTLNSEGSLSWELDGYLERI